MEVTLRCKPPAVATAPGLRAVVGLQRERRGVHAVAQAGRPRSVLEHVAKVAATGRAHGLGPGHEERSIRLGGDGALVDRGEEARPAGPGLVLRLGAEELGATAGAAIRARSVLVPERAREGSL